MLKLFLSLLISKLQLYRWNELNSKKIDILENISKLQLYRWNFILNDKFQFLDEYFKTSTVSVELVQVLQNYFRSFISKLQLYRWNTLDL